MNTSSNRRSLRSLSRLGLVLALAGMLGATPLVDDPPMLLSYQARLTSTNGTPITQPQVDVTFTVYDSPVSGTALYTEQHLDINVTDGLLSVLIGSIVPLDPSLFESPTELYLGVKIEADDEMAPRVRLASVPFAFRATAADDVPGKDITPNSVKIGSQTVIDNTGAWTGGSVPGVPAGTILMSGRVMTSQAQAPAGFLYCNGEAVSRTTYAGLFAAIGVAYGAGDGSTTFNLPMMAQHFPMGRAFSGTGSTLGEMGGAIDHSHGTPSHTHAIAGHGHSFSLSSTGGNHGHSVSGLSIQSGGSHTHPVSGTISTDPGHDHPFSSSQVGSYVNDPSNPPSGIVGHVQGGTAANQQVTLTEIGGGHAHTLSAGTAASAGAHSHTILGSLQGSGNLALSVTGTVGNASTNGDSGLTTDAGGIGATSAENPPFVTVNFIIKY